MENDLKWQISSQNALDEYVVWLVLAWFDLSSMVRTWHGLPSVATGNREEATTDREVAKPTIIWTVDRRFLHRQQSLLRLTWCFNSRLYNGSFCTKVYIYSSLKLLLQQRGKWIYFKVREVQAFSVHSLLFSTTILESINHTWISITSLNWKLLFTLNLGFYFRACIEWLFLWIREPNTCRATTW